MDIFMDDKATIIALKSYISNLENENRELKAKNKILMERCLKYIDDINDILNTIHGSKSPLML